MNKKLLILTLVTIAGLLLWSCGENTTNDNNDSTGDGQPRGNGIVELAAVKPDTVRVYMDKSGSMAGYFVSGQLKDIVSVVTGLDGVGAKTEIGFYGDKAISGNVSDALSDKKSYNKNTDLVKIFENLTSSSVGGNVSIFVSDCILSNGGKATTADALPELENQIAKIAKDNPGLSYSLYRFEAPFNGAYCMESVNKSIPVNIDKRPYYMLAVGAPAQLVYLRDQIKGCVAQTHVNTEKDKSTYRLSAYNKDEGGDVFDYDEAKDIYVEKTDNTADADYVFKMELPKYIKDNYKGLIRYSFNDRTDNVTVKDIPEGYCIERKKGLNDIPAVGGEVKLRIWLENPDARNYWTEYSSDDDSKIKTDSVQWGKTFGLEYLVRGLKKNANDAVIFDKTFTLKKY